MTAGNSTPLTDGASVVLLASEEWADGARPAGPRLPHGLRDRRRRLRPRRRGAADGAGVRRGADAPARRSLAAGLRLLRDPRGVRLAGALDAQGVGGPDLLQGAARPRRPLGSIDRARLNVNGSSLAAGHPFAATGGRIVDTLAKLLDQKGGPRPDLDLRRRRPGRRRDPREVLRRRSARASSPSASRS